jgi:aminopeptidase N
VELGFDLAPARTIVANRITLRQNPASKSHDIVLHGEEIELVQMRLNGKLLSAGDYDLTASSLTIRSAPAEVVLEIETICAPVENTTLSGLYVSNGNFFTQCEAEGFRRITFFPDRPDVMAKYTVMLRADKAAYPVLLSNGNLIEEGDLGDGRHYAKWEDPFKSHRICSRWSRPSWCARKRPSSWPTAATCCCKCGWKRATSTRPTTPCSR